MGTDTRFSGTRKVLMMDAEHKTRLPLKLLIAIPTLILAVGILGYGAGQLKEAVFPETILIVCIVILATLLLGFGGKIGRYILYLATEDVSATPDLQTFRLMSNVAKQASWVGGGLAFLVGASNILRASGSVPDLSDVFSYALDGLVVGALFYLLFLGIEADLRLKIERRSAASGSSDSDTSSR